MTELYLFNKEEVLINIIPEDDFNNDSHVRELNSKWSFEFTTTFQYLNDLSKSNKVGFYDRYREFRLFKIIKRKQAEYNGDAENDGDTYCPLYLPMIVGGYSHICIYDKQMYQVETITDFSAYD